MTARMPSFLRGLIVLLLVACPSLVHAATLNVPSTAYPTIQSGVDAAQNGDTVLVADGTYSGPGNRDIDFHGKSLTVTSQNGPTKTIIDCGGSSSINHRGFYFHNANQVAGADELHAVVSGLTIENGYELVIAGITDSGRGGGICIDGGYVSVENCIVVNNFAYQGGGVYDYNPQSETTSLTRCIVGSNNAQLSGGDSVKSFL